MVGSGPHVTGHTCDLPVCLGFLGGRNPVLREFGSCPLPGHSTLPLDDVRTGPGGRGADCRGRPESRSPRYGAEGRWAASPSLLSGSPGVLAGLVFPLKTEQESDVCTDGGKWSLTPHPAFPGAAPGPHSLFPPSQPRLRPSPDTWGSTTVLS